MTTTLETTKRPAGEAAKAFREYLSVHPRACEGMGRHDMDDMALELARIALDFQAPAPIHSIPAGWEGSWKWMQHPDWNYGEPMPVQTWLEGGIVYYRPFDHDNTAFEWEKRSAEWQELFPVPAECLHQIAVPVATQAACAQEKPETLQPGDVRPIVIGGTLCEDGRWWCEGPECYVDPEDCTVLPLHVPAQGKCK